MNQGTLYPLLLKLEQEGAIASDWGPSDNNRRARFYRLTAARRRQLQLETRNWQERLPGSAAADVQLREELESHLRLQAADHERAGLTR